jgi:hypothetical protein
MVQLIKKTMNVEVNLLVLWVPEGLAAKGNEKDAPAWVTLPVDMPPYGSKAFRELRLEMCFRRPFLERSTYDQASSAIAHELSHVILESIKHPLRKCEKAVDLTAMLLGFSRMYESGSYARRSRPGYLSLTELQAADQILTPAHLRFKTKAARAVIATLLRFWGIILIGSVVTTWAIASKISDEWQLHQSLVAEQAELQTRLPTRVNAYNLVAVRVGITALTYTYNTTVPRNSIDTSALKMAVNKDACANKRTMIKAAASYNFEFWDQSGALIARFEVASCP